MPVLQISDGQGKFLSDAPVRVWVVMNWPGAPVEEKVEEVLAMAAVEHFPQSMPLSISAGTMKRLMEGPPTTVPRGVLVALFILSTNLQCAQHHPRLIGYRRAGRLLSWASDSTIKRAWRDYGPVAHLWVAKLFLSPSQPWQSFLAEFLAYSEAIRVMAETTFAHGQKKHGKPLLDPEKTWTCPRDIELPSVTADFPPLKDSVLKELRRSTGGGQRQ